MDPVLLYSYQSLLDKLIGVRFLLGLVFLNTPLVTGVLTNTFAIPPRSDSVPASTIWYAVANR